jgi:DNA-binding GntR family transcriptional regulator
VRIVPRARPDARRIPASLAACLLKLAPALRTNPAERVVRMSAARVTPARKSVSPARGTGARAPQRGPDPVEEELYRVITGAIVTKQLRPGARLKEAALASQFNVSRARVRRVFQRLAELDFVEFRLNHGALIRRPRPDEARAVFATRRLLETEAVRETARRATSKDFARLRKFVEGEGRAFRAKDSSVAMLSSQFHILLGELCGNSVLARILSQLVHRSVLIQSLYHRQNQPTPCLVHEHAAVVTLMEQGKVGEAIKAMQHHLDHLEETLDYESLGQIDERLARSLG